LQMVFLAWFALKRSRKKIAKYFDEIIEIVENAYEQIYKCRKTTIAEDITYLARGVSFEEIFNEFLVGQPPHNQLLAYFSTFQAYLIFKNIYLPTIDLTSTISKIDSICKDLANSDFFPKIVFEHGIYITKLFYFQYDRIGLTRNIVLISAPSNTLFLRKLLTNLPNCFLIYEPANQIDGNIFFFYFANKKSLDYLNNLLNQMKSRQIIRSFLIIPRGNTILNIPNQKEYSINTIHNPNPDISILDFYVLERIDALSISHITDIDKIKSDLENNFNEKLKELKREFRPLQKQNPIKFGYLNDTLNSLSSFEKNPNLGNILLSRFIHMKINQFVIFHPVYFFQNIFNNSIQNIRAELITNSPHFIPFNKLSIIAENDLDQNNHPILNLLYLPIDDLFQLYSSIYHYNFDTFDIIKITSTKMINFYEYFDTSNNNWNFNHPEIEEFLSIIPKGTENTIRTSAKSKENSKIFSLELIPNSLPIPKYDFPEYFSDIEFRNRNMNSFIEFIKSYWILENPPLKLAPKELTSKIMKNQIRGDRLICSSKSLPSKRFWLIITSGSLNLSPILNYHFIQEIFKREQSITSISFQGGIFNGLLLIEFSEYEDLNYPLLKNLIAEQIIKFDLFEILQEYRWFNETIYKSRDFSVKTYNYLAKYHSGNYPPMEIIDTEKLYFSEFPLLHYVAGFNLTYLYEFDLPSNISFDQMKQLLSIFALGRLFKTSTKKCYAI